MRFFQFIVRFIPAAILVMAACDHQVDYTNPYDSRTDEALQAPGTILGQVLLEGQSVHGDVVVTLVGRADVTTFTDSAGNFELLGVPDGIFYLSALAPDGRYVSGTSELPIEIGIGEVVQLDEPTIILAKRPEPPFVRRAFSVGGTSIAVELDPSPDLDVESHTIFARGLETTWTPVATSTWG